MSGEREPDRLTGLESALRGLKPAPAAVQRDRLFFRAGQASARRSVGLWSAVAACLGLALGAAVTPQLLPPRVRTVERVVYVEVPAAQGPGEGRPGQAVPQPPTPGPERPSAPEPPEVADVSPRLPGQSGGYLGLRDRMLRWGVEAVPPPAAAGHGARPGPSTLLEFYSDLAERKKTF